jgi:N-sulfoglucosamine sulfohydrolase
LFDIELDPHEGKNLSADPEFTAVMEIMKAKLKDYQQQTNDPWIIKWKYE